MPAERRGARRDPWLRRVLCRPSFALLLGNPLMAAMALSPDTRRPDRREAVRACDEEG